MAVENSVEQNRVGKNSVRDNTTCLDIQRTRIESPSARAVRRFLRHRLAVTGLIFIVLLTIVTFPLASIVAPIPPEKMDLVAIRQPPSVEHILGTNAIGRDVFSRVVYGGRVSMAVGLFAVLIFMTIGTTLRQFVMTLAKMYLPAAWRQASTSWRRSPWAEMPPRLRL